MVVKLTMLYIKRVVLLRKDGAEFIDNKGV